MIRYPIKETLKHYHVVDIFPHKKPSLMLIKKLYNKFLRVSLLHKQVGRWTERQNDEHPSFPLTW